MLLFGDMTSSMLYEDESNESSHSLHIETTSFSLPSSSFSSSSSSFMNAVTSFPQDDDEVEGYARGVISALFHHEIVKKINMGIYKERGRNDGNNDDDFESTPLSLSLIHSTSFTHTPSQ